MGRRRGGGTKGGREGRSFSPSLGSWMSVFLFCTVSHKLGSQSWTSSMTGLRDQLTGWFEYLVSYVLLTPAGYSARAVTLRTWFLWMSALAWSALSFWEPGIWVSRASVLVATGHFLGAWVWKPAGPLLTGATAGISHRDHQIQGEGPETPLSTLSEEPQVFRDHPVFYRDMGGKTSWWARIIIIL